MTTPAKRLTIYLGEGDSWRGHSLYMTVLETLRQHGIAGATVTRAIAGFGAHNRVHTNTIEVLSADLPIVIAVIDTPDNIARVLPLIEPMVREGLITLDDIQIVKNSARYLQPLPAYRPVSEIMTRQVTCVTPDTPAVKVVELLLGKMFKAVPVVDRDNRVVGIISDGDLLRKAGMPTRLAVGERLEADDLHEFLAQISQEKTARAIMTSPVITARADESLGETVHRMLEHSLKRLPVVDSWGKLVGMVSQLDILRAAVDNAPHHQEQTPVPGAGHTLGDLMSPDMPTVHVKDDLVDVLKQILQTRINRVIVLDDLGRPVGIITDSDLVARVSPIVRRNVIRALAARAMGTGPLRGNITAHELMSENVLSAPKNMTVAEAITLLLREGRKRLIVVDEQGRPLGIVDRHMLMAASLES